ncbi:hypothetical protein BGX31_000194 [Mortierella sp. GBA43]|nr:hypothetical protein BGX31_000194 [Mortierella sp. GBA43]
MRLLGLIVGAKGIKVDTSKLDGIETRPEPTTTRELQHYLGLFNYFWKYIPMYSKLTAPLDRLSIGPTESEYMCRDVPEKDRPAILERIHDLGYFGALATVNVIHGKRKPGSNPNYGALTGSHSIKEEYPQDPTSHKLYSVAIDTE